MLQNDLQTVSTSAEPDTWTYIWNSDKFSPRKAYKALTIGTPAHDVFKWIWSLSVLLRYKIFFWLLIHDRINTRSLLSRKSFHLPNYNCVLYQCNVDETVLHIFFDCPFALECWSTVIPNKMRGILVFDECCFARNALPRNIA